MPAAVCTSLTGAHSRPHTARRSGPGHPSRYRRSAPAVVAPALMHGIGRACPVVTAGWISHRSSPPGAASPGVSGCRTPATTGADGRAGGRPVVTAGANQTGAQPRAARCQPGADGRAVPHRPSGPISPKIIKELHLKRSCWPCIFVTDGSELFALPRACALSRVSVLQFTGLIGHELG